MILRETKDSNILLWKKPLEIGFSQIWIFNMEEYCRIWHCVWHSRIRSCLDYIGLRHSQSLLYWQKVAAQCAIQWNIVQWRDTTRGEECGTNMGRSLLTWHSVSPRLETALIGETPSSSSSSSSSYSYLLDLNYPTSYIKPLYIHTVCIYSKTFFFVSGK